MQRFRTFILAALWLVSLAAQAQWQWLDKDGRKVFSDRAPPLDIPATSILKQPRRSAAVAPPAASAPAAPASAASAASPVTDSLQLSGQDKELAERKKKADAEAAAKLKAEADAVAKVKASNCATAKASQALMDSGVRVAITNAKGEREVLDDAGRTAAIKRNRSAIAANCQ